jgi:hypothetical protein
LSGIADVAFMALRGSIPSVHSVVSPNPNGIG